MPRPCWYTVETELTGRVRVRIGLFGRIVPQVQVICGRKQYHCDSPINLIKVWRDATQADFLSIGFEFNTLQEE